MHVVSPSTVQRMSSFSSFIRKMLYSKGYINVICPSEYKQQQNANKHHRGINVNDASPCLIKTCVSR